MTLSMEGLLIWTYSIVRLDKRVVDCHDLHFTVFDAMNRLLA